MDEQEARLYREAVPEICGNLQIERALAETLKVLESYMPADGLILQVYEHRFGAMRALAEVRGTHQRATDFLIPLPRELIEGIERWTPTELPDVRVIRRDAYDIATRVITEVHGIRDASLLVLTLLFRQGGEVVPYAGIDPAEFKRRILGGSGLASLVVVSRADSEFSSAHARLLALLREPFAIAVSNALQHRALIRSQRGAEDDRAYLERRRAGGWDSRVIGADGGLAEVMAIIRKSAPRSTPLLLLGETGTGKEVLAREIHRLSRVSTGPFVAVNCGAIPAGLVESEFFGHEKGAFTGATAARRGYFERADGGSLFLDELGELPKDAQAKLLRALQTRRVTRVGGSREFGTDFRLISASNRDLEVSVREGSFREDLWYRVNVLPIRIKGLRERPEDVEPLARAFAEAKAAEMNLGFEPRFERGALDRLRAYSWPGNVRELENVIERALILSPDGRLAFDGLSGAASAREEVAIATLDEAMKAHIEAALARTGGKIQGPGGAAELLAIHPNTLRNRMDKLGIERASGHRIR